MEDDLPVLFHSGRCVRGRLEQVVSMRRFALWLTFLLVVMPSTLASFGFTVLALGQMAQNIGDGHFAVALFIPFFLSLGWFGLMTLWWLFIGLLSSRLPESRRLVWAGLAAGCAVDLCLLGDLLAADRHRFWESFYVAWPILAAIHYGLAFERRSRRDRADSGDR